MDQTQTIQAWADYVIERWELEIIRLGINSSGQLLKSFTSNIITQSGGNVEKIIFAYEYYGKFVDMGVGNGVKIGNPSSSRVPKPWYNKVFYGQVKRLAEIMQEKFAHEAALTIVANVESYDSAGNKQPAQKRSGGHTSKTDPVTGKKKMTYSEFKKKNQDKDWWKG